MTLAHETATSLPMIPSRSIKGLHLTSIEHPSHFDPDPASSSLSHPSWKTCRSQQSFKCIPLAQLSRQDPILLYAEVSLLKMNYTITEPRHGKNCSYLLYILFFVLFHKITDNQRVMPTSLFILVSRFILRVYYNVLFDLRTDDFRLSTKGIPRKNLNLNISFM